MDQLVLRTCLVDKEALGFEIATTVRWNQASMCRSHHQCINSPCLRAVLSCRICEKAVPCGSV